MFVTAQARFISTCVEQTVGEPAVDDDAAVHLHVRGADSPRSAAQNAGSGSSPRAWSRRDPGSLKSMLARFISTCVEQTFEAVIS